MIEASVTDLYLAAFRNPEYVPDHAFESLLLQKQIELEQSIRERLANETTDVARLILLVLDDSWEARFPNSVCSRTREAKLAGRALLLEKVSAVLDEQ